HKIATSPLVVVSSSGHSKVDHHRRANTRGPSQPEDHTQYWGTPQSGGGLVLDLAVALEKRHDAHEHDAHEDDDPAQDLGEPLSITFEPDEHTGKYQPGRDEHDGEPEHKQRGAGEHAPTFGVLHAGA